MSNTITIKNCKVINEGSITEKDILIKEGRFDDTNKMFVKPEKFDCHVTTQDAKYWASKALKEIE